MNEPLAYTNDRFAPQRRRTRVVMIGGVPVGGDNPVRVQSMTTTFTKDADATLEQIAALDRAGCEIIRVTVPTMKDAAALPAIRAGMAARGITRPIVADIHFSPKLAMLAVEHVDKVRINPGNFTDSKQFAVHEYSDAEYAAELARIEEVFTPLVLACKQRGVAMRIGTNHGSLSDRIMNRYGDSPLGMVESALEFVRICEQHDYRELVLSMKASNTQVMVEAYRLLAARMAAEGMDYPFHLGVTEAGGGEDARIKSAIGIGGLLEDGIGDTLRVSLTEDPVAEVPVGFALARRAGPLLTAAPASSPTQRAQRPAERVDPYDFVRRPTRRIEQGPASCACGGDQVPRVEAACGRPRVGAAAELAALTGEDAGERRLEVAGFALEDAADRQAWAALAPALAQLGLGRALSLAPALWRDAAARRELLAAADRVCLRWLEPADISEVAEDLAAHEELTLLLAADLSLPPLEAAQGVVALAEAARAAGLTHLAAEVAPAPASGAAEAPLPVAWARALAAALDAGGLDLPLVLAASAAGEHGLLDAATALGGALIDGLGDAVRVEGQPPARAVDLAYGILQGARRRTTRTEYISCPGCGRTLFELEPVTAQIQALTGHLKGVKIAVMGCIVNGPGEMADADFGYVGWKPGKVNLYVGKECVVRSVPEDEAPARLVQLIKDHGRWCEPSERRLPVTA